MKSAAESPSLPTLKDSETIRAVNEIFEVWGGGAVNVRCAPFAPPRHDNFQRL